MENICSITKSGTLLIRSLGNKAYVFQMPSGKVPVYCHMASTGLGACGGGGWTLVMKIDGNKVLHDNRLSLYTKGGSKYVLCTYPNYEIFESLSF